MGIGVDSQPEDEDLSLEPDLTRRAETERCGVRVRAEVDGGSRFLPILEKKE